MNRPRRHSVARPRTQQAPDIGVTAGTVSVRGRSVVVRSAGQPATGVTAGNSGRHRRVGFLHGLIGAPDGHPLLQAVAAQGPSAEFRLVAPCLPGFTGSEADPTLRSMHDWVASLSELIDETGLAGKPMVAASVGAMLALELLAIRPDVFSELTLIAPFGLWDDDDPVADGFGATLGDQRRMLTANPEVTAPFFEDPDELTRGVVDTEALVDVGVERYVTRATGASLVWPIPDHGLASRIHRVKVPCTLIWGGQDAIIPPSYLRRFSSHLVGTCSTAVLEDAGHLAAWDNPSDVLDLIDF